MKFRKRTYITVKYGSMVLPALVSLLCGYRSDVDTLDNFVFLFLFKQVVFRRVSLFLVLLCHIS